MTDQQKENDLGIMFGIDGSDNLVNAFNRNVNATTDYNNRLNELQKAANKQEAKNRNAQYVLDQYNKRQDSPEKQALGLFCLFMCCSNL